MPGARNLTDLLDNDVARQRLGTHPAVERLAFGFKEQRGTVLPEYAFRVYVRRKKPLNRLSAAEIVPSEIDGIRTDVLPLSDSSPLCGGPKLTPGKKITRDVPNWSDAPGTLGCLVQKEGVIFILTNQHVIVPPAGGAPSKDVYQPERSQCGIDWRSPVATVIASPAPVNAVRTFDGKDFDLDCGLLKINDGVSYANVIEDIGAIDTTIRDLASEATTAGASGTLLPVTPVAVHKRGMQTGITHGVIVEFAHQDQSVPPKTVWRLVIAATTGYAYDETHTISTSSLFDIDTIVDLYKNESVKATILDRAQRKMRFQGTVCSLGGDSGSLWVDDSRHACGLHFLGAGWYLGVEGEKESQVWVHSGKAEACFIRPVLLSLGLDPKKAIAVPSSPSSGPPISVPGDEIEITPIESQSVSDLEARLLRSEAGEHMIEIFREHHREFLQLLNRRRRLTSTWHRSKGPAFVAALMNMARTGDEHLPKAVGGYPVEDLITNVLDALLCEGSDRIRADAARNRAFLLRVVRDCDTIDDLLQMRVSEDIAYVSE
jgi:hypothetical protein